MDSAGGGGGAAPADVPGETGGMVGALRRALAARSDAIQGSGEWLNQQTSTCIIIILSSLSHTHTHTHTDAESEEGDWDDEEDEWGSD